MRGFVVPPQRVVAKPPPAVGGGGSGAVDLTQLPTSATRDTTAYSALSVTSMAAGTSFDDPVTGVLTTKLTSSSTAGGAHLYPHYSTLGLSISQAWGAGGDEYTVALITTSAVYLIDYKLGGTVSNARTGVGGEGHYAFSRVPGNERIMYVQTTNQLRRYDTQANAYADTGSFPYSWSGFSTWLQINNAETYATGLSTTASTVTKLNLSTGAVVTLGGQTGLDEVYNGYNDVAFINRGATSSLLWNLSDNSTTAITGRPTNSGFTHVPSLRGFWMSYDSNTGGGNIPWGRVDEDGTFNSTVNMSGYWGQQHSAGQWWDQAAGDDQYFVMSNWDNSAGWTASLRDTILFVNAQTGAKRVLGHHYSVASNGVGTNPGGTDGYWSQPHANISTDGKIVLFGSNMLDSARIDAFVMETPRA